MQLALPPLLALSPGDLRAATTRAFLGRVERACAGGLEALLLREAQLPEREYLALGRTLRGLLRVLVVHDRAHLVQELSADALQLGFRSLPPSVARGIVAPGLALGYSAHAGDAPELRAGADFLLLGPLLRTPSKEGRLEPLGFEGLARECARETRPVWAIGGLQPEHAAAVRTAGARGMAVLRGVLGASDPERAARSYLEEWAR